METQKNVYLDYAAATPLDDRVLQAMLPYFSEQFFNPSAPYALSRGVKKNLDEARASIAHAIGSKPDNVTFTAGATEANNLAFAATRGHVIVSAIEHDSVLACTRAREHTILPVSGDGLVDPAELKRAITPQTELVSIALANGEIGTVQPIRELAKTVMSERKRRLAAGEKRPIWLHTDASQAASSHALNVSSLNVDMMTVSAAKIYGPKQVGLLWSSSDVTLQPLVLGGGQENGLRSGTENVAGIIGFSKAFEIAQDSRAEETKRISQLRNLLQTNLLDALPWAVISGPVKSSQRLCNLLHISFPHLEARRLVIALDKRGVSVGTGSACAASKMHSSHVLDAIGADPNIAKGSLRITLGRPTTDEQIEYAAQAIIDTVRQEMKRTGMNQEGR